jgi:hypothetical protein
MTLLGYSLPAEFSLLQGAQDDDLQFDEDPQLGFGCRIGCCFGLYVCQPTLDSADAAGQAKRDCVCQPTVDSADAAGQAKRDCVCQPTVDSADAAGQAKRDCLNTLSLLSVFPARNTVRHPARLWRSCEWLP